MGTGSVQNQDNDVQAFKGVASVRLGAMLHIGRTRPLFALSDDFAHAVIMGSVSIQVVEDSSPRL